MSDLTNVVFLVFILHGSDNGFALTSIARFPTENICEEAAATLRANIRDGGATLGEIGCLSGADIAALRQR